MENINVQFFGVLEEITGKHQLTLNNVSDTDSLKQLILKMYPELKQQQYTIALNNCFIDSNSMLTNNCTVACMPPFAGG